jgi:hypothetical protein
MTTRITKGQKIAGIAAIGVRNVLQRVYDDSSFNEQWLAEEIYWLRTKGQFEYTTRRDCLHWLHSKDAGTYTHYPACRLYRNASLSAAPQLIETLIQQGFIRLNKKEIDERSSRATSLRTTDESFAALPQPSRFTARRPMRPLRHSWSGSALSMRMISFFTGSRRSPLRKFLPPIDSAPGASQATAAICILCTASPRHR